MDAIVNAANAELRSGGGVAGAIHRGAGPGLEEEGRALAPIRPGQAVITGAHRLPNRYVIHCLGPVYGRDEPAEELLANCYANALRLTEQHGIQSMAFPAISTGIFGYPIKEAARVALKTVLEEAPRLSSVAQIRFVLFDEESQHLYEFLLDELTKHMSRPSVESSTTHLSRGAAVASGVEYGHRSTFRKRTDRLTISSEEGSRNNGLALFTDLYELTMLQAYFEEGMTEQAVFTLFVRRLPPRRNFLLACGVDSVLDYLETIRYQRRRPHLSGLVGIVFRPLSGLASRLPFHRGGSCGSRRHSCVFE